MNPLSIGSTTSIYETISRCEITRYWVEHTELAGLSRALRLLVQSLDTEVEEEYWQRALSPVRRLAFAFCSTPLPFNRAATAACIDWDKLHRHVRHCAQTYPDSYTAFSGLVQILERLSKETGSPFTEPLESLHGKIGELYVVMRNPRMNQAVAEYFSSNAKLRNARIIGTRQLRGPHLVNALVSIGPCGWFPEYVFSAPRSSHIHVMSYPWIRDPWKPGPVFLGGTKAEEDKTHKHYVGTFPQVREHSAQPNPSPSDLQPLDVLPPLPHFGTARLRMGDQCEGSTENVSARLCYLSGSRAVFIAADEGASSLIIDTSETGDSVVRRVPAEELEPELYLLLRTAGGGDFIVPLANRILGRSAEELRAQQTEWKNQLVIAAEERFGTLDRRELSVQVAIHLRSHGLSEPRPANVRYWMSSKCIHPRKEEDFMAILTFAGLAERTQELWSAMGEIDRAHKKAGHTIRQLLLQKIGTISLEPLERDGEMIFELNEQDGGTLSAFQITSISTEHFEVPIEQIGIVLDSED